MSPAATCDTGHDDTAARCNVVLVACDELASGRENAGPRPLLVFISGRFAVRIPQVIQHMAKGHKRSDKKMKKLKEKVAPMPPVAFVNGRTVSIGTTKTKP